LIYLAGPYTSRSFEEHKMNIGRLLTFYIYLQPLTAQPIVCPPLESAGFDQGSYQLKGVNWIKKCLDLIKIADEVQLVPGHLASKGCQMERREAKDYGILTEELSMPSSMEISIILESLNKLWAYNPFAPWAREYIISNFNLFP